MCLALPGFSLALIDPGPDRSRLRLCQYMNTYAHPALKPSTTAQRGCASATNHCTATLLSSCSTLSQKHGSDYTHWPDSLPLTMCGRRARVTIMCHPGGITTLNSARRWQAQLRLLSLASVAAAATAGAAAAAATVTVGALLILMLLLLTLVLMLPLLIRLPPPPPLVCRVTVEVVCSICGFGPNRACSQVQTEGCSCLQPEFCPCCPLC